MTNNMIYLQLYIFAGIIYTIFMYEYLYKGIRHEFIKTNYSLYSLNTKECNRVIKLIPLLFVFVWPINVLARFINYIRNNYG